MEFNEELRINDLYHAAIAGDISCEKRLFALLDERFRQFVRHRVWDSDSAEDIVQDALLAISRELRHIQIEKSFAAWAYKVLNNRIVTHMRDVSRRQTITSEDIDQVLPRPLVQNPMLRIRLIDCLQKLNTVNHRYARVVNLHRQGYSAEEISEQMELSRNAIYILLHRARAVLSKCMTGGEDQ